MSRRHSFAGSISSVGLASVVALVAVPAVIVAMLGTTGMAYGQPPGPGAHVPEQSRVEQYGGQVAFVDAAAVGMLGLAWVLQTRAQNDEAALAMAAAGVTTWWVGPPVLHGLRGNGRGAVTSLALRTLLPTAAGVIAWKLSPAETDCPPGDKWCEPWPAGLDRLLITGASALAGAVTASIIDWIALSKRTRPGRASRQGGLVPVTPVIDVRARSLSLGFRGIF